MWILSAITIRKFYDMSVFLEAPYPNRLVVIRLPNPTLNNTVNSPYYTNIIKTMNGSVKTIIKTSGDLILKHNYQLRYAKAQELYEFYKEYGNEKMRMIDYNDIQYIGHIINDPFSFQRDGREDFTTLTLEFRGKKFA